MFHSYKIQYSTNLTSTNNDILDYLRKKKNGSSISLIAMSDSWYKPFVKKKGFDYAMGC